MSVIIRQYGGSEDLIRLDVGDVVILKSPGGTMYAKAVPEGLCSDCCLDAETTSTADYACMKYKLLCSTGNKTVNLKRVDPEQIVEDLI